MPCQPYGLAGRECGGAIRRCEHISHSANRVKFIRANRSGVRDACFGFRCGTMTAMHWLDRLAGAAASSPLLYEPVFTDGWGDHEVLEYHKERSGRVPPIPEIDIVWSLSEVTDGVFARRGDFMSPAADDLPAASVEARVLELSPLNTSVGSVVFMAAFNDHGFKTRSKLAIQLAAAGITTLMLENPYYGTRRPQAGQPIRRVTDFFAMGSAAVIEGRALLGWLKQNREGPVGITGYSMGGNIAALISATTPFPIATAALAASFSPGPVWIEGLLTGAIAWDALGGVQAQDELAATLGLASALRFPPPSHTKYAVLANPEHDGYIPRWAFEALHSHWPGSELRWINSGHAGTMLWRKGELLDAIVHSIDRINASGQ